MCGISGALGSPSDNIQNIALIKKIIDIQKSRGPDNNNYWISDDKKVIFGHNRLSIIDLSADANQPLVSEDKNYIITFNGEIYNYKDLKKELVKKNVSFKTNSDTEVIIQSYKYWGLKCLEYFRGMFAFAIYDKLKKKIILARDPFGIKPLYFVKKNNTFYFASQIKSLLSIKNCSFTLSKAAMCSYYLWGHIQDPFTLYNEIKSLDKGSIKKIDVDGNEKNIKYCSIKKELLNSNNNQMKWMFRLS